MNVIFFSSTLSTLINFLIGFSLVNLTIVLDLSRSYFYWIIWLKLRSLVRIEINKFGFFGRRGKGVRARFYIVIFNESFSEFIAFKFYGYFKIFYLLWSYKKVKKNLEDILNNPSSQFLLFANWTLLLSFGRDLYH